MNLVEATLDGDGVRFGQYRVPLADAAPPGGRERVVLGIRPESFEDAAFAPGLPTIDVEVEVLEELGSDAHVFFHVDAAADHRRGARNRLSDRRVSAGRPGALHRAGRRADGGARSARRSSSRSTRARFHFFDPETRRRASTPAARPSSPALDDEAARDARAACSS